MELSCARDTIADLEQRVSSIPLHVLLSVLLVLYMRQLAVQFKQSKSKHIPSTFHIFWRLVIFEVFADPI